MERIVVGVDGSTQSKEALRFALQEGRLRNEPVLAVHAWMLPVPPPDAFVAANAIDYPGLVREFQHAAEGLVESVLDEVVGGETAGTAVEGRAVEGPPAAVLLDAASDARMTVVGSRGRGGFERLLLGSVSEQVARHAPCPVVIHRTRSQSPE